jgi:hypothetical protein
MSMKTTFTPGHYRRRVAGVLARRLIKRLFDEEGADLTGPAGRAGTGVPARPDVPGTHD